jgi:LmbE family N-acetylglucosaminyl deacetylase
VIRQVRPKCVLTQSPERNLDRVYGSHPDHLATGEAAVCAVYPDSRNRWAHPELESEGLEPWTVEQLWIGAIADGATHYIEITDAVDRKIDALLSHKSQLPDPDATEEMVRGWTSGMAESAGLGPGTYAEAIRVVHTV